MIDYTKMHEFYQNLTDKGVQVCPGKRTAPPILNISFFISRAIQLRKLSAHLFSGFSLMCNSIFPGVLKLIRELWIFFFFFFGNGYFESVWIDLLNRTQNQTLQWLITQKSMKFRNYQYLTDKLVPTTFR